MSKHTATNANILSVAVDTNCPQGGDSGHGGRTTLELLDEGGTDIEVTIIPSEQNGAGGVRVELGGDSECSTLIECLRFAADELERQVRANVQSR